MTPVSDIYEFLRTVQMVVYAGLAAAALVQWRRHPSAASGWLAATFGVLGAVVALARLLPVHSQDEVVMAARQLVLSLIVLFPYFLYRFTVSFVPPVRWIYNLAAIGTALLVVWPWFIDRIPEPGDPRPRAFQAYVVVLLVQWAGLSLRSAYLLWRGGAGHPSVARRRMRTLALGAVGLAIALVVAGARPATDEVTAPRLITQALALLSAPLLLLGFAPPRSVRASWRRAEEAELREAEKGLMQSLDAANVADILLPHAAKLVGGREAFLTDRKGGIIGCYPHDCGPTGTITPAPEDLTVGLEQGHLIVRRSPYSPFFGRDEAEILQTLATMADLALARAELVQQLKRSNEELEQFAYVASHDLQEPLRTVASYAELLGKRNREELDDKSKRHIDYIIDGCTRMQDLIDDLLSFSRVGTRPRRIERVDPALPLGEVLRSLQILVSETDAVIEVGDLPQVEVDRGQLTQLFQNLLSNAIKYRSAEAPRIVVTGEVTDSLATFSISDNGLGIEPRHADRIFTIFQRLHTRGEYPGTGIGLAICKKIVERHGGRIWVESDGRSGSTFKFTLPVP